MNISFPHIGNYHVPVEMLLKRLLPSHTVLTPPPITKKTLELGAKYSPDFVCVPFKYNLGNYIEALENGAEILIQAGGGCRYGFYGELQEQILKDLGFNFRFINLFELKGLKLFGVHKILAELDGETNPAKILSTFRLAVRTLKLMDEFDKYIRENIGFEAEKDGFIRVKNQFLKDAAAVKNLAELSALGRAYAQKYKDIKVNKPEKPLRAAMIGELYTLMEPFSNYFMEKELAKSGVVVSRYINMSYLLFQKTKKEPETLKKAEGYLKYTLGADGTDSVARCLELAKKGYDGVIHVKPFGCTPEVNAMPVLMKISNDYKIPVLFFSFDSQTSETGVKTRLEAFCDMLERAKSKREAENL